MKDREQLTVRLPKGLLDRVRQESAAYGDSMNDLVVVAVQKEVQAREQLRLLKQIEEARRKMAARGLQPDSSSLIRQLRMRVGHRD
ncbi:MAG TPA: Arc family DNA-binding protein [Firmicutes bacterium]|nr:Arc family DNA-binding protein [Candidatus Fermentithermobacillaceae bacterium]